ncbi:MAG: hypothetical protein C4293_13450 [Nitrospiraceae bacterium]
MPIYGIVLSSFLLVLAWGGLCPICAEHDLARRLQRDAQVQSNNGNYNEARDLRAIADALKNKDASTSRQVQAEIEKGHLDKAKDLLRIR